MTLESKMKIATAFALAAVSGMSFPDSSNPIRTKHVRPKLKPYVPKMVTASQQEIAEWNAKVEAKKAAKKYRS